MTNMAEWIQAHREAALRTGTIAVMGGALTVPGNVNPFAEANILADPEAAKFLFESGLSFTMTGLDVTLKTNRRADQMEEKTGRWREEGGACGKVFADMLSYYCTNEAAFEWKKGGGHSRPHGSCRCVQKPALPYSGDESDCGDRRAVEGADNRRPETSAGQGKNSPRVRRCG